MLGKAENPRRCTGSAQRGSSGRRGSAVESIAGLDAAWRGLVCPWWPVAVILNPAAGCSWMIPRKFRPRREVLAVRIREHALASGVAQVTPAALMPGIFVCASRSCKEDDGSPLCSKFPDYLLLDAMRLDVMVEQKSLIHGDARPVFVAAASILAKVERDRLMVECGYPRPNCNTVWHSTKQ